MANKQVKPKTKKDSNNKIKGFVVVRYVEGLLRKANRIFRKHGIATAMKPNNTLPCAAKTWGPSCKNHCPVCYNGGVCEDESGTCICAPGFSGPKCQIVHGRNTFGQDGGFRCSGRDFNTSPGCQGRLLCQLDPYGCSCAAGYMGRDSCSPGTFGADCKQECHCSAESSECDGATGVCSGNCSDGWSGVNCQVATMSELTIFAQSATELSVTWSSYGEPESYEVYYQITNEDQCKGTNGDRQLVYKGAGTTYNISGLTPYSSYNVSVKSIHSDCETDEINGVDITDEAAPTAAPENLGFSATSNSITFTWDEIPCGNRGGSIIAYDYELNSVSNTTTGRVKTFSPLPACSSYIFKVSGVNSIGNGPYTSEINGRTSDQKPGQVTSLTVNPISSHADSLHVSWDAPHPPCAVEYKIEYQLVNSDQCDDTGGSKITFQTITGTAITINGLQAYSTYRVFVSAINSKGSSDNSNTGTTAETAPTVAPENLEFSATTTSLTFSWDEVPCGNRSGSISAYDYVFNSVSGTVTDRSKSFSPLAACSSYTFKVRGVNVGNGPYTSEITGRTSDQAPTAVPENVTYSSTNTSLTFIWDEVPCGYRGGDNSYKYVFDNSTTNITANQSVTFYQLTPCSTYLFELLASTAAGDGPVFSMQAETSEQTPSDSPSNVTLDTATNTSLTFSWDQVPCGKRGGPNKFKYQLFDNITLIEGEIDGLVVDIDALIPCNEYGFRVSAFNNASESYVFSEITYNSTDVGVLGPVLSLTINAISATSITLRWNEQDESLCTTDEYLIKYAITNVDQCHDLVPVWDDFGNVTDTAVNVTGLQPHSTYDIRVYTSNDVGLGGSVLITSQTEEAVPSGPPTIESTSDMYSIHYNWTEPMCGERNGVIQNYTYILTPGNRKGTTEYHNVTLEGLNPCTEYTMSVAAVTVGEGVKGLNTTTTVSDVPFPPASIFLINKGLYEITVSWEKPNPAYCEIILYTISIRDVFRPYDEEFIPPTNATEIITTIERQYTFSNLRPSTEYEFKVYAHTEAGMGRFIARNFTTKPADESELGEPPQTPTQLRSNATSLTIEIPQLTGEESHYLTEFKVRVEGLNLHSRSPDLGNSYEAGNVQKTEVKEGSKEFIIGGGETDQNPPLLKGEHYNIYLGSCSVIRSEILRTLFSWRRTKDKLHIDSVGLSDAVGRPKNMSDAAYSNPTHEKDTDVDCKDSNTTPTASTEEQQRVPGPVRVKDLKEYIKKKKSGQPTKFKDDFFMLPQELLHSYATAKHEDNRFKNRYANIATYDHSRVKLSIQGIDLSSDYINASYIDGYNHPNKYIASQGPNKTSIPDFWRMIWEYKLNKIVMLTNLVESGKIKCDQYWPDKVIKHGTITVSLSKEEVFAEYTIRSFTLANDNIEGNHLVCQFHFTAWPDMSVPDNISSFLNFMKIVKTYMEEESQPIVVHCSAGVGRTGAFIAIQSLIEQAQEEGLVDVFQFVCDMRHQRMKMIQTPPQYEFIFDALLEHVVFGDTSIPVSGFREAYTKLKTKSSGKSAKSGLDIQFENLQDVTILPNIDECSGGTNEENVNKNRFKDVVPADRNRPYLMSAGVENSTNYINATYIHSYRRKDAFLTTQMPLPNTVCDFWRMVKDYKCATIVMLNHVDQTNETLAQYWPNKGSTSNFGPFAIECKSEKATNDGITIRVLKLLHGQFIIGRIIGRINVTDYILILFHTSDGMGVSGTFCAIVSALDRLATEQTVDIFQTAKRIRKCNSRAIQDKKQYSFIYDVVQDELDSGQVYENFVAT
ncbi:receptor-type tyrosine-protein phosphatase kappa-like [Amphiura filiformis]|uniref:receptor-type tyrosine-protein phosphatase kappa-like n=1 Tax=Amphiura filiformis TaxID=82378 RepID=UPI003B22816A